MEQLTGMDLVRRADEYAAQAHQGQTRRNLSGGSWIEHSRRVSRQVTEVGGSPIEIAGGLLHDVVEHGHRSLDEILQEFGEEVAEIVAGMTTPAKFKKLSKEERKRAQAEWFKDKSKSVKLVEMADLIDNLESLALSPVPTWSDKQTRGYISGCFQTYLTCCGLNSKLDSRFMEAYSRATLAYNPAVPPYKPLTRRE